MSTASRSASFATATRRRSARSSSASETARASAVSAAPSRELSERELALLARVDDTHHVLVGYLDGDPAPVGIARLVRDGRSAEVAFEVADAYQGRGIGTILTRELAADARAAGITELHATVCGDNPPAVSLLARVGRSLQVTWRGRERELVATLEGR